MFVGYSGRNILYVSDELCHGPNVMQLPEELRSVDFKDLVNDYEVWHGKIVKKGVPKQPKELKIAFVGVYRVECGISTYSEWLFPEIYKHAGDYRIFAENADIQDNDPKIIRCWNRGEPLNDLMAKIDEFDPDVVLVQHEYGIFPSARHWISFITQVQKYKTIVTLHSVYNHKDKVICEAPISEMVVHTEPAKDCLVSKNVPGKVYLVPHGCQPVVNPERYWNIYQSPHTIMQFGFGFRYKGWENSLEAVSILKKKYPDVFFTGLFSESPYSKASHNIYYSELEAMIRDLGIQENVGIVRGFVHDNILEAYLRTNQVAIFPYIENGEHTVFGCSGAARRAMHFNIPTIVTNVPLFADFEGICSRAASIDELCHEIEILWNEPVKKEEYLKRQQAFLEKNSFANAALKYLEILTHP